MSICAGRLQPVLTLVVHGEGGVLAVAEIVGGIGQIHTLGDALGIVAAGIYALALLAVHDGRAGVLTEGQLALGGHLGVAQHGECHKLIVFAGLGVREDFGYHRVVLAAEHEGVVVGALAGQYGQSLRVDDQKLVAAPVLDMYIVTGEMVILGSVGAERKHRLVLERFGSHIG